MLLKTPITVANNGEIATIHVALDYLAKEAKITLRVSGIGASTGEVKNGISTGFRRVTGAKFPAEAIRGHEIDTPSGFDDLISGGMAPAQVEATLRAMGWFHVSLESQ